MKHTTGRGGSDGVVNTDGHVIGLDIGASAVRAAFLTPPRQAAPDQPMTVEDVAEAELPKGAVVDGVVVDQATLTRVLTAMWRDYGFGCRRVIVGISNAQVVVREMSMPRLEPEQMARALPFQAKDLMALPLDKALLDFHPLPPSDDADADPETVEGLLIAAPRQPVVSMVRAVEAAGLRIARVDLASFAALRAVASVGLSAEAVVDIGAHVTNIVIHRSGVPRVVRTVSRGGEQLTERLVERTGVGAAEAEIVKREIGLLGGENEAAMILTSAIRPLLSDIRSSVQYFTTTQGSSSPDRITLTGGGAQLPGLAEVLASETGIPCSLVSPLHHVRLAVDEREPEPTDALGAASAVSVGLALGAAA